LNPISEYKVNSAQKAKACPKKVPSGFNAHIKKGKTKKYNQSNGLLDDFKLREAIKGGS